VFDILPNRVDTVKFVAAQRKLVDYVSTRYPDVGKIFSHGYEITGEAGGYYYERDIYKEKVKMVMH